MHGTAEEGDAAVGVAALGTIFEVAFDGTTEFGKLSNIVFIE